MKTSRRGFLGIVAGSASLSSLSSTSHAFKRWQPRAEDLLPGPVFRHGVASGDPLRNRVILWTRVTPFNFYRSFIRVRVKVATDPSMSNVVYVGKGAAFAYNDFTIKFDANGLKQGRTYYYQFKALGEKSPLGRTKTLPRNTDRVRLGVVSCSNYPAGYFGAYELLALQENLDAVLHLGDYIYEYANGTFGDGTNLGRIPSPNKETVALDEYRARHAQYKSDIQLQKAHSAHPWIVVWDDHESTNDSYKDGAENHQPDSEGEWTTRKLIAQKAYFEWMPIRDRYNQRLYSGRIFRRFRFGDLVQLDMLDTRLFGREQQVPAVIDPFTQELLVDPTELPNILAELNRPGRQILGEQQERWLFRQLERASLRGTTWQVLGQQIMMGQLQSALPAPFPPGTLIPLNTDQWDGYVDARSRILKFLDNNGINNTIVLTGDIHSSWFNDIAADPYDPTQYDSITGSGSKAVEFVTPAVSSPFFTDPNTPPQIIQGLEQQILASNPHTQYVDFERRGYLVLDIDAYRARGEWYHINTVESPNATEQLNSVIEVAINTNHGVVVS